MGLIKNVRKCLFGNGAIVQDVNHHQLQEQRRLALENLETEKRRFQKVLELERQVSHDPTLLKRVDHLKRVSKQKVENARAALE